MPFMSGPSRDVSLKFFRRPVWARDEVTLAVITGYEPVTCGAGNDVLLGGGGAESAAGLPVAAGESV